MYFFKSLTGPGKTTFRAWIIFEIASAFAAMDNAILSKNIKRRPSDYLKP
jgi:hypothetical protein